MEANLEKGFISCSLRATLLRAWGRRKNTPANHKKRIKLFGRRFERNGDRKTTSEIARDIDFSIDEETSARTQKLRARRGTFDSADVVYALIGILIRRLRREPPKELCSFGEPRPAPPSPTWRRLIESSLSTARGNLALLGYTSYKFLCCICYTLV